MKSVIAAPDILSGKYSCSYEAEVCIQSVTNSHSYHEIKNLVGDVILQYAKDKHWLGDYSGNYFRVGNINTYKKESSKHMFAAVTGTISHDLNNEEFIHARLINNKSNEKRLMIRSKAPWYF